MLLESMNIPLKSQIGAMQYQATAEYSKVSVFPSIEMSKCIMVYQLSIAGNYEDFVSPRMTEIPLAVHIGTHKYHTHCECCTLADSDLHIGLCTKMLKTHGCLVLLRVSETNFV